MLQALRQDGLLQTTEHVMEPRMPKHGDVCFLGGFAAENIETTSENHDPKHIPYGIKWVASLASGNATQQPSAETRKVWVVKRTPKPETVQQRSASSHHDEVPRSATEQPPIPRVGSLGSGAWPRSKAEEPQQAAEPQTAQTTTSSIEEVTEPASGSATEQTLPEEERQPLPADKTLAYSIVNELLGKITFDNPEAEHMLLAALEDESPWIPQMQHRIAEVFEPIFFHYPHGLQDRSVWEPRDTGKYISKWRQLAALREQIIPDANAQSMHFSKEQVTEIFKLYFEDFKTTLTPNQLNKKWPYYKGCVESKLRTEAGSRSVVYAIWEVGLPRVPSFATEQRCRQLWRSWKLFQKLFTMS